MLQRALRKKTVQVLSMRESFYLCAMSDALL